MSRVGRKLIPIPSGVEVKIKNRAVAVKGPLGELNYLLPENIDIKEENKSIQISRKSDDRFQRSLHGLVRSLVANMVHGVSVGFTRVLILEGVGYRAQTKGDSTLVLNVGYSHPVEYQAPSGIKISVEKNKISIHGVDKQQVGQTAANIRMFRKVEPYKGKGIRYEDEVVRRKVGKVGT